jgi:hypothetical protein
MVNSVTNSAGEEGAARATGAGFKTDTVWSTSAALGRAIGTETALSLGQLTSGEGSGQPAVGQHLLHRLATQVGEPVHLDGGMHLHRHLGLDPLEQVCLELGPVLCRQTGYGGVVVAICQLDGYPDQAPVKLVAVQCDEVVDCHVKLDGSGVDGQHLDWAQRGKQARRQVLTRKLQPRNAVLLEDDHNGVRLDAHQSVEGVRIAGQLHAERLLLDGSLLGIARGSRRLPISNHPTEQ